MNWVLVGVIFAGVYAVTTFSLALSSVMSASAMVQPIASEVFFDWSVFALWACCLISIAAGGAYMKVRSSRALIAFGCVWIMLGVSVVVSGARLYQMCCRQYDMLNVGDIAASIVKSIPKLGHSRVGRILSGAVRIAQPAVAPHMYEALKSMPPLHTIYWLGWYKGVTFAVFVVVPLSIHLGLVMPLYHLFRDLRSEESEVSKNVRLSSDEESEDAYPTRMPVLP